MTDGPSDRLRDYLDNDTIAEIEGRFGGTSFSLGDLSEAAEFFSRVIQNLYTSSQNKYHEAIDHITDMVYWSVRDGHCLDVNQEASDVIAMMSEIFHRHGGHITGHAFCACDQYTLRVYFYKEDFCTLRVDIPLEELCKSGTLLTDIEESQYVIRLLSECARHIRLGKGSSFLKRFLASKMYVGKKATLSKAMLDATLSEVGVSSMKFGVIIHLSGSNCAREAEHLPREPSLDNVTCIRCLREATHGSSDKRPS
ncbi:MAG: hypothetical protein D6698_04050 [Gammaproteobacteria bacterium]|nr:MAG: hypothetical protein D6698_04050 [Gammaproteobacteria bacterium]